MKVFFIDSENAQVKKGSLLARIRKTKSKDLPYALRCCSAFDCNWCGAGPAAALQARTASMRTRSRKPRRREGEPDTVCTTRKHPVVSMVRGAWGSRVATKAEIFNWQCNKSFRPTHQAPDVYVMPCSRATLSSGRSTSSRRRSGGCWRKRRRWV